MAVMGMAVGVIDEGFMIGFMLVGEFMAVVGCTEIMDKILSKEYHNNQAHSTYSFFFDKNAK